MSEKNRFTLQVFRLLKKPFFGRFQRPWLWPSSVARDQWKTVAIPAAHGTKLAGLYGPARSATAKATIVCAHAMGNEAKASYLKRGHAELLRSNGYNVLLFDFNGFGESESSTIEFPRDLIAAGRAAKSLAPSLPLGVVGISFGAAWALCALGIEPGLFDAAVLESGFTTLEEYWIRFPLPYAMIRSMNVVLPALAERLRPIQQAAKIRNTPLLLIYTDPDPVSPADMGERLLNAVRPNNPDSSLWVTRGAEHTKVLEHDPQGYEDRVLAFLDRALAKAKAPVRDGRSSLKAAQ